MNQVHKISYTELFSSTALGASAKKTSVSIPVEYTTNQYSINYWFESWTASAEITLTYEVSNDNKAFFPIASALVTNQTVSGSSYTVDGVLRNASNTVISGTHGINTGEFIRFSSMEQDNDTDWVNLNDGIYKIIRTDNTHLTIELDTSGYDVDYSAGTGTAQQHALTVANISSPILGKFLRFKISETSGNAGVVTLGVAVQ